MVVVPIGVRMAEKRGFADLAVFIAWSGYIWMGFVFILIVTLGILELFLLIMQLKRFFPGIKIGDSLKLRGIKIAVGAAFLFTCYGFCEALFIQTDYLTIRSPKIPDNISRIRIVLLSDVHVGVMIGKWRLKRMLDAVSVAKPDILLASGDIVDGQIHRMNGLSELFRSVKPRYGSFAVLGNHEFYVGLENSIKFLKESGFQVLRKDTIDVFPYLRIAGIDDTAAHRWGSIADDDEHGLFSKTSGRPYTILLKHRPSVSPESLANLDLQLSGHVHKGQIFPFNFLTYISFPVNSGVNRLANGSILYVSRGTGTWGPPIRFLAPPEVTVIDILPEKSR